MLTAAVVAFIVKHKMQITLNNNDGVSFRSDECT